MENISSTDKSTGLNSAAIILMGLVILTAMTITLFGPQGLIVSLAGLFGLLIIPFIYNKPTLFLFLGLFIYPLTRLFSVEEKFMITGALYTLSFPCALWIISKYFGKISKITYFIWGIALFTGVLLLNFFRPSVLMMELLKDVGRGYYAIFIILAVYNYVNSKEGNLYKLSLYLSYLINGIAVASIFQYITKHGGIVSEGIYRARGTFNNFNELGYVITMFICFALYFLLNSETFKQRFYWTFSIGLNLIALMTTLSKTSIITTGLVFLVMSFFLAWKRKLQLFSAFIFLSSILLTFLATTGTLDIVITRFLSTTSLEWRFAMWRRLYSLIIQHNMWIGEGANASRNILQLLMQGESYAPHNVYLETVYNYGLLGLIPFILIFVFALYQGLVIVADNTIRNKQNKIIGAAIITIAIVSLIQNFLSNAFYDRAVNVILWAMLTILVCWYRYYKYDGKIERPE